MVDKEGTIVRAIGRPDLFLRHILDGVFESGDQFFALLLRESHLKLELLLQSGLLCGHL